MVTARDLCFARKRVLLVEARDRIGGRTWTAQNENGDNFEMGGTWVHWQQPHVFAELQRYGLDRFIETKAAPDGCTIFSKATQSGPLVASSPEEAAEMFSGIERLMSKFLDIDGHGGQSVIPFPFNTPNSLQINSSYGEIDRLSIQDRVNDLDTLSTEEKHTLMEHAASFYGIPPDQAAFSEVLHTYALCNFKPEMIEEATMKFKLECGTTAFARAILDDYRGDRLFSSPVKSITQTPDIGASVLLESGQTFNAKVVVSTIPLNVIQNINFDPPLSELRHAAFTTGIVATNIDKLLATTSASLPTGYNISCEGGDMPFASGFSDITQDDRPLLTFLCQPNISLDTDDTAIRVIESLHPDGLTLTSAQAHLWSEDPYAGGVMPIRRAGFIEKYDAEVRKPHGKVYFCGSDFADGWRGFISGAIESAYQITYKVLKTL